MEIIWKLIKLKKEKTLKRALHNDPAILFLAWIQRIAYQRPGATAATHIYHSTIHYCQAVGSAIMPPVNG
jgi:hypothetical protein